MNKWLIAIALAVPLTAVAVDKFLDYQYNDRVVIRISNIPCKVPDIDKKKFELSVVAKRVDGQYLFGCFTHHGDDLVIQWAGGDQTILPASAFLQPDT
jgi:hypothetical protein